MECIFDLKEFFSFHVPCKLPVVLFSVGCEMVPILLFARIACAHTLFSRVRKQNTCVRTLAIIVNVLAWHLFPLHNKKRKINCILTNHPTCCRNQILPRPTPSRNPFCTFSGERSMLRIACSSYICINGCGCDFAYKRALPRLVHTHLTHAPDT